MGLAASAAAGGPLDGHVEVKFEELLDFPNPKSTLTTGVGVTELLEVLVFVGDGLELELDEGGSGAACTGTGGMLAPFASLACPIPGFRYQFASKSPRQSPTATKSYPSFLAVSISNWANSCTV